MKMEQNGTGIFELDAKKKKMRFGDNGENTFIRPKGIEIDSNKNGKSSKIEMAMNKNGKASIDFQFGNENFLKIGGDEEKLFVYF
ncbi:hypothetical protein MHBO_001437 [Bonamia ostreae]|uniref:Uncharacterized protein n=1 Tax=Bonamia ostreae TaxID=126728 RepID=A0ABV2AIX8_9EUKA